MTDILTELTADIVSAHVANNSVSVADISTLIGNVYSALSQLGKNVEPAIELTPAVSIRSSIKPDYIVCLEDGKKLKMLKRHLMTHYQMTPEDYRTKWGLPLDYPMVAPNYAEQRRTLAKSIGLGRKPGQKNAPNAVSPKTAAPKPVGRPKKAVAVVE
jgi:predicted transcriptional regulator